jgi:hypothetical protein
MEELLICKIQIQISTKIIILTKIQLVIKNLG